MIKYFLSLTLCCGILTSFAQRYNGVNLKTMKAPKDKNERIYPQFHQLALGLQGPRSMNLDNDGIWFESKYKDSAVNLSIRIPGIQFEYSYHWNRFSIFANFMYESLNTIYNTNINDKERLVFTQFTSGIGINYKWLYNEKLELFSGIGFGFAVRRFRDYIQNNQYSYEENGIASWQSTILGLSYNFNNFGFYSTLGYGKKGIAGMGLLYRI